MGCERPQVELSEHGPDLGFLHHRDARATSSSPWTLCGGPRPPFPSRGAPECPDCAQVIAAMWEQAHRG